MHVFALIFVCGFPIVKTENCPISHQSTEEAWEKKLMNHLKTQPATAPTKTVNIYTQVILRYFMISDDEKNIEAGSDLFMSWVDERLKWNSDEYQGISYVVYDSYTFWEPDIKLLNEVDYDEYRYHFGLCRLEAIGLIYCGPRITHEAPCLTKVANWPYDVQNCTLQIGIFAPFATINITYAPNVIFSDGAEYSAAWTVIKLYREHSQVVNQRFLCEKGAQIDITFLLLREGAGLSAIVVYPAILMAILTLSSFLFIVQYNMRLRIICFNILCHFWFIKQISDLIPKHSEDTPTLLLYLRESLLINMFLVILTIFLSSLSGKTKPTPPWINLLNDTVSKNKIGLFIWPQSNGEVIKKMSVQQQIIMSQWTEFSNILNCFCLWLVTFVYICLICLYIPRKPFVERDQLQLETYKDLL